MSVMVKGVSLELGDGNAYVLPPLTLGALEILQDKLNTNYSGGALDPEYIKTVIDAAHLALRRNYPDITRDQVKEIIGLENMEVVFKAVLDVSGMFRKSLEAEAKAAQGNAQESQSAPTGSQ
jgi:hypothetical protein